MFRRSRLSVRPNVGTGGRTAPSQETSSNKDPDTSPTAAEAPAPVTNNQPADPEQTPGLESGESSSQSAIQRRKRFSVRPKVVPGRPSALPRAPKSPIKPLLPAVKSPPPAADKAATQPEPDRPTPPQEEPSPKEIQAADKSRISDTAFPSEGPRSTSSCSQVKEAGPKAPVPPSIPDREAIDISEKAKTLVSKTELGRSSQHFSLTQLLNDRSDLLRLEKARKLRQLLKQEMLKEKSKKCVMRAKEFTLDPSKMTMRDLIHYLPTANPMSSTLEENENETIIPQSPGREISPERAQEHEVPVKMPSPSQGEATATTSADGEQEQEDEEAEEEDDALMVPQVKVAEDGSLIIDEESLTVEVQRMKGPNPIQDRDPIFERGSTTTYSSFRKGTHTKPWSTEETDMFFLAISMVGTDFAMISQLFPHRARTEIKNKFKKEERCNAWRIDKAFRERRKLDLVYFNKLLEKILEYQQSKKKLKSISEKPKARKRKPKAKAVLELSDVEEENEDGVSIEEQEGEKENLCNEGTPSSKTQRKRKNKDDSSPESPDDKKKKRRKAKKLSDDTNDLADLEDSPVPQDHQSVDQSKKTESGSGKTAEPKSLPLSRKGQKAKKSRAIVSDSEADPSNEETQKEKDNVLSPSSTRRTTDNESSDHETPLQTAKPSRYGRISKPVQPLNYPAKEDTNTSASDSQSTTPAKAKTKTKGKRRRTQQKPAKESKKPKLITLRASQSEASDDSDDDDEHGAHALHYDDDNAFVPASLCSPKPVVPEVEETMEELDMLAHMPDVLGMSENVLFPDASCERAQNEGTVEACEHQLDLLVDVIDFLSENAEASDDESYNEAAQTLLAIGNLAQPTESQPSASDHMPKLDNSEVVDISRPPFEQEECAALVCEPSETEHIPTNSPLEQPPTSFTSDTQVFKPTEDLSNTEETDVLTSKAQNSGSPPREELSTRTTELLTQTISASLEKPDLTVSEPTKFNTTTTDDRTDLPSHVPSLQNDAPCSKEKELEKTPNTKATSSPSIRQRLPKIKPNISGALRTAKRNIETVEEKAVVESEMTSSSELDSQQNESCSAQGEAAISEPETACSDNASTQRKGRFSKIKPKPNIGGATRTTKQSAQLVSGIEETLPNQSEMASTSQAFSAKHEIESTEIISEQSKCQNKTTEEMKESHSSDIPVIESSDESSSTKETDTSSQLDMKCSKNSSTAPRKGRFSKVKPNIACASRNTKQSTQSVQVLEEKSQNEPEMASPSHSSCLEYEVESTKTFSEQSNCQNIITSSTEETLESHLSDIPIVEPKDESSSTEKSTASSQLISSDNSSVPRKGRFSKIKPKPNIGCASRTLKQSTQSVHALEEKSENEPKMASTIQPSSSNSVVESTPIVSEQSTCQNKTTSSTKDEVPECHASSKSHLSDTPVIEHSGESSATQETASSSELETVSSENSSSTLKKGRFSRIKPKPNIGGALRNTKQSTQSLHAIEEKLQHESEMVSTSPSSSRHEVESTQNVSGPSSFQNKSDPQIDEISSTQETACSSQLETASREDCSTLRKGRLTRIKPKPNIERTSRTPKQSLQSVHSIEDKLQKESELPSTSQTYSSKPEAECSETTQNVSEQSSCQNKTTSSTDEMPKSCTSDPEIMEYSDESSFTQETPAASQLETLNSKSSSTLRKGRFSKIKPKPNIEKTSRSAKQCITDKEHQTVGETAASSQVPFSESVQTFGDDHQESLQAPMKGSETSTHGQIDDQLEQGQESCTLEKNVNQFTETRCTLFDQSSIEPLEQPRQTENTTSLEPEIPSTQCGPPSAEEKTEPIIPPQLSDPTSESLRHSTPQRRRWVPKAKPKPNLVSSPRTSKLRVESKEKSEATEQFVQSSLSTATSELPMIQEPHDQLLPVTEEPDSIGSVPSVLDVSLSEMDQTLAAGIESNTPSTSKLAEEVTSVSRTDKIYEDSAVVQDQCEPATNQTDVDHCSLIECAPSDSPKSSNTVCQLQDLTARNTEICFEPPPPEICTDPTRPAEGAVEPPTEPPHSEAALPLGLNQTQDSFEFKNLIFQSIPPDQVPSDPDEPFFILSLTEIPVCPSGEEVHLTPGPYHALPGPDAQQSNPIHPVAPAGIDDSLSNIYIPTPEKVTLKSDLIRVEEYLPSAPSKDISILEEPRGNASIQRPNQTEIQESLSANEQPSAEGDVEKRTKTTKKDEHENLTQDPECLTQMKNPEEVTSSSVVGKLKKTEEKQTEKSKASGGSQCGQTETQSSEAATADFFTCSLSSEANPSTSSSSELLGTRVKDSFSDVLDKEPSSVSEFFFCDVFTEVDGDCNLPRDKTQSEPAETKVDLSQCSRPSACGQTSSMTAPQPAAEALNASEATVQASQQENKKSRGRGSGNTNRKSKTPGESKAETSRPQRKSTAGKLPQDSLIKNPSSSSRAAPQDPPRTSEIGSSVLEEPTDVSQCFLSDVFMDVESKSNSNASCSDTTPRQKTETKANERQKRRKASSAPPSGRQRSLTEGQPPDEASQKTPSSSDSTAADSTQRDTKKTRGKGASKKSLKKSTEALKNPEAVDQGSLEESQSSAPAGQTQEQPGSVEVPVHKGAAPVEDTGNSSATRTRNKSRPQPQPSETSRSRTRKTKASSCPSTEAEVQETESVSQDVQESSVCLKGKGRVNEKTKVSEQKQDTAVLKSPARIKETPSTSSTVQPEIQQDNPSDDDEPTNVSQFFLTDIFTDVDEEFKS